MVLLPMAYGPSCASGCSSLFHGHFSSLLIVAIWSSCSVEFCQGKLSGDPGIWALLYFFGLFTQAEVYNRKEECCSSNLLPQPLPQPCSDNVSVNQHYYLNAFCDQVNISGDYFLEQVPPQLRHPPPPWRSHEASSTMGSRWFPH
ncbi:hypothetical protein ACQJBY_066327 [Aegilops geniculata]